MTEKVLCTGGRFRGSDLRKMVLPLFVEQLLIMLVGIADTFVISYCGEAAVRWSSASI